MELFQLRYFIEVAEQRNFTRAAERLRLAQPALSQQVKNLEAELGTPLLVRGRRESVLTRAGEIFLPKARALVTDALAAKQAVADAANLKCGRLVVAAIPSISGHWLPAHVRSYRQSFPNVELVIMEGSSDEVCDLVYTATADLGFVQLPVDDKRFSHNRVLSEEFVAVFPARHSVAKQNSVSLADLADEPFILYKGKAREVVTSACQSCGFDPRVACETGQLDTVRALVTAGLGIAVLPELALANQGRSLAVRPIKKPSLKRELGWITRQDSEPSNATIAFLEVVQSAEETIRKPSSTAAG